ncbi:MAG TPA: DUF805 domain-containing protein [Thioalkalivibrio sp.]|nr:DUF805 domain-containing protein [Thioalkalivibrio sp.]
MSATNPYTAPGSAVADAAVAYAEPKVFGTGRLGRLRYFGYSFMITFALYIVLGIAAAVMVPMVGNNPEALGPMFIGLYLVAAVVGTVIAVFLGVQRLHDMGYSGWLWLLLLVPIVNILMSLFMLFAPGTDGENQYGLPPKPNNGGVYLMAIAVPVVMFFFIGLLAAIAVPAYQEYVERAQQMEMNGYNR